MMATRIPPMIVTEPKKHDPRFTTLEACCDEDDDACILVPLRPILFFSYEGQVAVEGIVATLPSRKESREKYDEQSSQKVVGKLNLPKELNQEKVKLQFAHEWVDCMML